MVVGSRPRDDGEETGVVFGVRDCRASVVEGASSRRCKADGVRLRRQHSGDVRDSDCSAACHELAILEKETNAEIREYVVQAWQIRALVQVQAMQTVGHRRAAESRIYMN